MAGAPSPATDIKIPLRQHHKPPHEMALAALSAVGQRTEQQSPTDTFTTNRMAVSSTQTRPTTAIVRRTTTTTLPAPKVGADETTTIARQSIDNNSRSIATTTTTLALQEALATTTAHTSSLTMTTKTKMMFSDSNANNDQTDDGITLRVSLRSLIMYVLEMQLFGVSPE